MILFDLGRQVAAVLDFDEPAAQDPAAHRSADLVRAPSLSTSSTSGAASCGSPTRCGYPAALNASACKLGQGLVGAAVATPAATRRQRRRRPIRADIAVVPGMASEIVVPLIHKSTADRRRSISCSREPRITSRRTTSPVLRQVAAHVAVVIVNARLFEQSRQDAEALETLAEIGNMEVASVLDLDQLFARIAQLTKRLIDDRTFGIRLLNEAGELEIKLAPPVRRAVRFAVRQARRGPRRLRRAPSRAGAVADVSQDPRYIEVVADVRSELVIPMLIKDRCIGVVDLESPDSMPSTRRTSRS